MNIWSWFTMVTGWCDGIYIAKNNFNGGEEEGRCIKFNFLIYFIRWWSGKDI